MTAEIFDKAIANANERNYLMDLIAIIENAQGNNRCLTASKADGEVLNESPLTKEIANEFLSILWKKYEEKEKEFKNL